MLLVASPAPALNHARPSHLDLASAARLVAEHKAYELTNECEVNGGKAHRIKGMLDCLTTGNIVHIRAAISRVLDTLGETVQTLQLTHATRKGLTFQVRTSAIALHTYLHSLRCP